MRTKPDKLMCDYIKNCGSTGRSGLSDEVRAISVWNRVEFLLLMDGWVVVGGVMVVRTEDGEQRDRRRTD